MTTELEDLREEVRQLREALYGELTSQAQARVSLLLGLSPQETDLVACLHAHRCEVVRLRTLYTVVDRNCETDVANLVKVIVLKLRRKGLTIITHWGVGYALDPKSYARVHAAFLGQENPALLAFVAEPRATGEIGLEMGWSTHQAGRRLAWLQKQRLVIQRADMRWKAVGPLA